MSDNSQSRAASIKALLQPASIAIAGASRIPASSARCRLTFLKKQGYAGSIYPLHPSLDEISASAATNRFPRSTGIDLLVIASRRRASSACSMNCRQGQVKAAADPVVRLPEIGPEGVKLQNELARQAFAKGIRFVGELGRRGQQHDKVIPSISQVFDQTGLIAGPIGFVSQSGAWDRDHGACARRADRHRATSSPPAMKGNLEFGDFCDYFAADPSVRIIAG